MQYSCGSDVMLMLTHVILGVAECDMQFIDIINISSKEIMFYFPNYFYLNKATQLNLYCCLMQIYSTLYILEYYTYL